MIELERMTYEPQKMQHKWKYTFRFFGNKNDSRFVMEVDEQIEVKQFTPKDEFLKMYLKYIEDFIEM